MSSVYLNRIETAVPANEGNKKFISFLPSMVRDPRSLKLLEKLAAKSQIERRYSVLTASEHPEKLDADGFFEVGAFATTARRMNRYRREALPLAEKPVASVLEGVRPQDITHLIVTSCTGFYAPGLDLELQTRFGLKRDLERSIIGFMGCHAAFVGMRSARHIVVANPKARVLMVNLELCSLHLQENGDPQKVLGALQFADGCAASLISAEEKGLKLERFHTDVAQKDADLIRWNVGNTGFDMALSMELPKAVGHAVMGWLPQVMSAEERAAVKLWAVHPGGRAILDVVQNRLELTDSEISPSRAVLRNFGNMSSATIMFVLKSILEDKSASGLGAALAFGPGLTVESMIFNKQAQA